MVLLGRTTERDGRALGVTGREDDMWQVLV